MKTLTAPDVRVKRGKPSREQKNNNKIKVGAALIDDNEVRLRLSMEVYDHGLQRYSPLQGESIIVRCRTPEAVAIVLNGVGEAVEVLDQLRLGK
jgi:hypothetical protein